ncbi:MAG TPA: glycosyltransferase, partial [Lapillicoccus sp.]|nr:glycosyltransferase [Lapillicoccus sp.]
ALHERAQQPDLRGRVKFLGSLQDDDLADFYRGLDVLAVPSLTTPSWVEQFGRVAVEAMAAGVPVVASDSGALPDVVGGAGLLVRPGDAESLRTGLSTVLDDADLAGRFRRLGLRRAATCDWEAVADRYVEMYQRATHTQPATPARDPAVVVVAYGAPELLRRTLEPLSPRPGTTDRPVLVVDNSSSTRIRDLCRELAATYVDSGHNGGFGSGVNLALGYLDDEDDVLLLNPDAVVGRDEIARLAAALHADPGLASVAPALVDDQGDPMRVTWPFPTPAGAWLEAAGLGRLRDRRPAYVVGTVLLLRAAALRQVGAFDERFFIYAEETDWARRAARLGWRHALVPSVTARHAGAGTSSDPTRRETHFHGSQELYLRKHHGPGGWYAARSAQIVGSAVRSVVLPPERRRDARRRLGLYVHGPARAASVIRPPAPSDASAS